LRQRAVDQAELLVLMKPLVVAEEHQAVP